MLRFYPLTFVLAPFTSARGPLNSVSQPPVCRW